MNCKLNICFSSLSSDSVIVSPNENKHFGNGEQSIFTDLEKFIATDHNFDEVNLSSSSVLDAASSSPQIKSKLSKSKSAAIKNVSQLKVQSTQLKKKLMHVKTETGSTLKDSQLIGTTSQASEKSKSTRNKIKELLHSIKSLSDSQKSSSDEDKQHNELLQSGKSATESNESSLEEDHDNRGKITA